MPLLAHKTGRLNAGFTLVELLVVVMIIGVLIGILIPVVSAVRNRAYEANSRNQVANLVNALQRYNADFRSFPGPFHNDQVGPNGTARVVAGQALQGVSRPITGAENMLLGLLGGLNVQINSASTPPTVQAFRYSRDLVGNGPASLNPLAPKRFAAYLDPAADELSEGIYRDSNGVTAGDSEIPEFVDRFPEPLPVLYLRARPGSIGVLSNGGVPGRYQYDLDQIIAYTASSIGGNEHGLREVGAWALPAAGARFDNALAYFKHPHVVPAVDTSDAKRNETGSSRANDAYILISAGRDRIYGTDDDICSFGNVR